MANKSMIINVDYNKTINSQCYCKVGLPWGEDDVVMAYPCEHMMHAKCCNKSRTLCKICNTPISRIITLHDPDIHHQHFADILSMTPYGGNKNDIQPMKFIDSIFDTASVFAKLPFSYNEGDGKDLCEKLLALNNMTLKVYGMEKLKMEKNKVYICNHVSYFEYVIITYLLNTSFLSSTYAGDTQLAKKLRKIVPMLVIDRGKKSNTVDEMKKYVEKYGSICLFPEGVFSHPDTLVRFRTGAFNIGYPVYAVTLQHNTIVADGYIDGFIYKFCGKRNITVTVHILGPYYPPFNDADIDRIRHDMAYVGNMVTSRVTNRDIVDK